MRCGGLTPDDNHEHHDHHEYAGHAAVRHPRRRLFRVLRKRPGRDMSAGVFPVRSCGVWLFPDHGNNGNLLDDNDNSSLREATALIARSR